MVEIIVIYDGKEKEVIELEGVLFTDPVSILEGKISIEFNMMPAYIVYYNSDDYFAFTDAEPDEHLDDVVIWDLESRLGIINQEHNLKRVNEKRRGK